ncbi:MAG: DNA replication protein [Alphaproteobacteria bacterium]|nr:DNA replication protein [Alphaproteobacteria bacterium]
MELPRQLCLDLPHRPALGREDFLVAPSNQEAVAWLDAWPRWPGKTLALCGPAGCGKSHLAHGFAAAVGAGIVEAATLDREQPPPLLAHQPALVIEDADQRTDPVALLHLYNAALAAGVGLLLTTRLPPARWGISLLDLHSRLATLPVALIAPPDDALMAAVLVKLFADRQLRVGPEVIDFLLRHMERSFDVARAVVAAADHLAFARRKPVAVPLIADVVRQLCQANTGS